MVAGKSLQKTEFILAVPHLCTNAASNETYSDGSGHCQVLPVMEVQLP